MVHVYTDIRRPDKRIIESYKHIGSATVYEAAGRIGSVNPNIKPLSKGVRILGTAFTVYCPPKDNLMLHKALQVAQEGDIIVAAIDRYPDAGYWGGLMATSAVARKIGGLAIDGCIRDSEEIISMGFSVFCRGTCIRGTSKRGLGLINHQIVFGDVIVNPGDLVLGDDDGMVIVPKQRLEEVLKASLEREEKEKKKTTLLSNGVTSVELNNLDSVFQALGMIEK